jgi:hypothetical protein
MNESRPSRIVGSVAGGLSGFVLGSTALFIAERLGVISEQHTLFVGIGAATAVGVVIGILFPRRTANWIPWWPMP